MPSPGNELLQFFLGFLRFGGGVYWVLNSFVVTSTWGRGYWGFLGVRLPIGVAPIPLLVGIGLLFFLKRKAIGGAVSALGLLVILISLLTSLEFHAVHQSLYVYVLMFGMVAAGAPLLLRDKNGQELTIEIVGNGDKLDLQKTCDRMDITNTYAADRTHSHYRQFSIDRGAGHRILGYKKIEETIPQDAHLYAMREPYLQDGKILLGVPKDKTKPFIVTTKSETQLLESQKTAKKLALFGGVAGIVLGIILMIVGLV